MLVVVFLSVLGVAKYLNFQPRRVVSGLTHLAAQLQNQFHTQLQTHINTIEYLSATEKICIPAMLLLVFTIRVMMIKKISN
jgi:hypothetical protein